MQSSKTEIITQQNVQLNKNDEQTIFEESLLFEMYCFFGWLAGLVLKSCPTLETPWTVACKVSLPMGLSRQEYWSGLPFPSPGNLPDPGIKPGSPALQADSLPTEQ